MLKPILLVEDNPNDLDLALRALARATPEHEVITVRDGEEALDYLHCRGKFQDRYESNPVVVFLDIKLPKITGIEVLKRIRGNPQLRDIPVVMLTSSDEEIDVTRCHQLGIGAYVIKPLRFRDFIIAVQALSPFWAQPLST